MPHLPSRSRFLHIKANSIYLPAEEKLAYGGALCVAVSVFFPWFSFDLSYRFSGLQNITWLIGYSVLLLAIGIMLPWGYGLLGKKVPSMFVRQTLQWGISGFLIILLSLTALSIYSSFHWIAIESQIHFGIYLVLLGGMLVALGAWTNRQKGQRPYHRLALIRREQQDDEEDEIETYLKTRSPRAPVPPPTEVEHSEPAPKPPPSQKERSHRTKPEPPPPPPGMFEV